MARLTGETIFLDATLRDGCAETVLGKVAIQPGAPRTGAASVLLRPEQVHVVETGVEVRMLSRVFRGDHTLVSVLAGGTELTIRFPGLADAGKTLHLQVTGAGVAFPSTGG